MDPKPSPKNTSLRWLVVFVVVAAITTIFLLRRDGGRSRDLPGHTSAATGTVVRTSPVPVAKAVVSNEASRRPETTTYASFQKRPFQVVTASNDYEWTAEDGKSTNVIRQLAHNDLEYQRMVEENSRIIRRQLVYDKDTAAALIERARLTGEPIRRLTLPGLDGQEVEFEITKADLNPSGQQGMFAGRVAGRADSMVTLAFKGGREAFTVISPSENLFLQGDPHEPGDLIVKSIDPDTYVLGVCGNP
jgi:hypothetical protein